MRCQPPINSLSDEIIHGTLEGVKEWVEKGAELNEIDAYGFTPLIQTAIVNNTEMAQLLLSHGANPNELDLTKRSALHWAVDNNNYTLAKALLSYGADANATNVGGQSVLVMPLLRQQRSMKMLLTRHGANVDFARDFIHAKLMGHRFELKGYVDIVTHQGKFLPLDLAGFYLEFTLALIQKSIVRYKNHYSAKRFRRSFEYFDNIIEALDGAKQLMSFQHYLVDKEDNKQTIRKLLLQPMVIIPIAFEGHAISFIKMGQHLAKCDRGANSDKEGSVVIYRMDKSADYMAEVFQGFMYKKQTRKFIQEDLIKILGLKKIKTLPLARQRTGNCSWANVEACIPALLFMQYIKSSDVTVDLAGSEHKALYIYERWLEWDRRVALNEMLQCFYEAPANRRASMATILMAVLYQNAEYFLDYDMARATRIFEIFNLPEYQYILKSYIESYGLKRKDQQSMAFMELVDLCGILPQK